MERMKQDEALDWKRPDQVMKLHKFKLRKLALQSRFNGSSISDSNSSKNTSLLSQTLPIQSKNTSKKRKNPFVKNDQNKKPKESSSYIENDSADSTFELLQLTDPSSNIKPPNKNENDLCNKIIDEIESTTSQVYIEEPKGKKYIPIDWALKTKLRLMSSKAFAWKGKLKASEEASGTTGFVRCLDIGEQETTLDTSPNARFHQCCLVWQHPSIPWMELFPRSQSKMNLASSKFVAMNQLMKDALYKDWCSSFRSLFHLLRVRQCPYFYVCGNNFTVLFRAAGICGIPEVQALVTPTTRGLRESLKNEEIQFTMPLKPKDRKPKSFELSTLNDDDEQNDQWLKSVGIEESEIRRISFSQSKVQTGRECDGDNLHESLVFVTGVEAQALFNFLINCKTIITTCGPYSGVPPTLLSPVAFHSATLKPLRVRESTVSNGKEKFYSLELTGPILPDVLPSLCSLISCDQLEKYSVSAAQLTNTIAFSLAKHGIEPLEDKTENLPHSVFGLENLTDCGFNKAILSHFCNPDPDRIQNFESLTCVDNLYTWT